MKLIILSCGLFIVFSYSLLFCDSATSAYDILVLDSKETFHTPAQRLIAVYQRYISQHDEARCGFYPTCSDFYMRALNKYGFIWGTIMTVDRLFYRESEWSMKHYPYVESRKRRSDPVYHNFIFHRSDYYR